MPTPTYPTRTRTLRRMMGRTTGRKLEKSARRAFRDSLENEVSVRGVPTGRLFKPGGLERTHERSKKHTTTVQRSTTQQPTGTTTRFLYIIDFCLLASVSGSFSHVHPLRAISTRGITTKLPFCV